MITIAKLTIGEAIRRRVLLVLIILAAVAVGLVTWGVSTLVESGRNEGMSELNLKLIVSQILIFIAWMFGFVLVITAAFFGSPAIATELESGIAQAMLARPLPRASYLLGRWLGLAIVILGYAVVFGLAAIGIIGFVSGYLPPDPILPVAYLAGQALVVLSLTVLLSTRLPPIAGGAIAVVVYGLAWMAGVLGKVGQTLDASALVTANDIAHVLLPTDALWQGVVYGLEPSFVINAGAGEFIAENSPFFASAPPPIALVAWSLIWVLVVLNLAVVLLRRREL